jgi:carbonic anhydrase/acetyltransferase-like protein (isoleucine patch superfamily)
MIHRIGESTPDVEPAAFIAWNAEVVGEVRLGRDVGIWFSATLRGDIAGITIGDETNIQDGSTLHVDEGLPLSIGQRVTVGHNAVLHGCVVGDDCLIGIGAVVLSGAVIGAQSIVGAGSLVTEGKSFPPRTLIVGSPAKAIRSIDDAMLAKVRANAAQYVRLARQAAADYREVPEGPPAGAR